MSGTTFKIGDRVYVTDPGLASLREIMQSAGFEPEPNHHGEIHEDLGDGNYLIYFDDGMGAPYPAHEIRHLNAPA